MIPTLSEQRVFRRHAFLILAAGLLVQGWLWQRQGILADQNAVLYSGTQFLRNDSLPAFAKPSSAGAQLPGFLLPAMVGGALAVWHDYRSPTLLAMALHVIAFVLLAWVVTRELEPFWSLAFLALYWLSVWRLFQAASAWEPAFVLLPAALHIALCYRLRDRARFLDSTLLVLVLAASFQIHASSMILVIATVWLLTFRKMRLNWAGLIVGLAASLILYLPTIQAVTSASAGSGLPQTHQGLWASLLSLVKGATFWLRLSTPDLGERLGQAAGFSGRENLLLVLRVLLALFIVPSALVTLRMVRKPEASEGAAWLRTYTLACLGATLVASLISPASVQTWHVVIVLHAALLPLILFLRSTGRLRHRVAPVLALCLVANLFVTGVLGLWHAQYTPPTTATLEALGAPAEVRALVHGSP